MASSGVDRRALERLIRKVRASASSGGLYDRTKAALAAEALTQVQLGFEAGRDPYGEPWQTLRVRDGRPLRDTGRLMNSFTTELVADGFRIGTATFRYSLDDGASWEGANIPTASECPLAGTGVALHFAAGDYQSDNVYVFSSVPPQSGDGWLDALEE